MQHLIFLIFPFILLGPSFAHNFKMLPKFFVLVSDPHIALVSAACIASCQVVYSISAQYWGELWPNSPTYARFPNLLYTAELLCIKQNINKVLPPYANSHCHKVAYAGNPTSSFSISAILHSCILGYSCFFIC